LGGSKAREAGLKPAGEDGTYFQFFNLKRSRVANSSTVSVNGKTLDLWKRFVTNLVDTTLEGSVVWLDKMPDNTVDLKGKIVAINLYLLPFSKLGEPLAISLYRFCHGSAGRELLSHGFAAIILLLMIL
jgi:hypothetical protein